MKNLDFLIIGGGVAGTTAAETIKTLKPEATVSIIESENYPLYSRVQLPQYLRGLRKRDDVFLRTLEDYKQKGVELVLGDEVASLDVQSKTVKTSKGNEFVYGKLLITTGGTPKRLNKYPNEHYLQTIDDTDKVMNLLPSAKKGVVVGSGFIALEFLETFMHYKLETSLCVSQKGFWSSFLLPEVSTVIMENISLAGATVYKGTIPEFIAEAGVLVGTGVGIDISESFFSSAGVNFDLGIVCNEYLQTSVKEIFAAGDVAKFYSQKLKRYVRYGNWTNALISGKAAGTNMASESVIFDTLSSYSIKVTGMSIVFLGFAGLDEKTTSHFQVYSNTSAAQFFIRDGMLDGCVLVNKNEDRMKYQQVIDKRLPFYI